MLLGFVERKQSWLTKAQEGRLLVFKSGFVEMGVGVNFTLCFSLHLV